MAWHYEETQTRRALLLRTAALVAAIATPIGLDIRSAHGAKVAKSAMGYQSTPNGDKRCATCTHFIPQSDRTGSCKIVEGKISAKGWCRAWMRK